MNATLLSFSPALPEGNRRLFQRWREPLLEVIQQHSVPEIQSAILDALPANVALLDRSGTIISVNHAWRQFACENGWEGACHGVGADYLATCYRAEASGCESAGAVARGIEEVLKGSLREFIFEYDCHSPRAERWFQLRVAPVEYDRGCGAVVMHLNITDRKQAEQKLVEQATLLDHAREAIIVHDLEGRITFWNNAAERIYGWSASEALGRPAAGVLYDDPAGFHSAKLEVLQRSEWQGEVVQRGKTGRNITVDSRWTLIRDGKGNPRSVLAINSDITEKKKLETQFLRAQRMESLGTLAGGIAHDLNNVFAPIMMGLDILQERCADRESEQLIRTLRSSTERGADLVRQVLSFARGVGGQRIPVNPLHVVREIQRILRDTLPKSITFEVSTKGEPWTVLGDPTQIYQVLLNLSLNARDAMPNGGLLSITLENVVLDSSYAGMTADAKPGSYVKVAVTDTGMGIPSHVRERIFEPFFTTKELGKGTGLGLSTSLAIVKSHRGFINLYSECGKGSRFSVYLPRSCSEPGESDGRASNGSLPRGSGELILVVDDEESVRRIARTALERQGYRVLTASHGAEAVSIYAQNSKEVGLVVTDMAMPVMDGPSLIAALESLNPEVKVIGSSGLASGSGTNRSGIDRRFVPKPYTAAALLSVVHEMLSPDHEVRL